ncbi:MAG: glycyl-radical enzyme activating protein [Acutalibacteraceae bacterium]|nr:glycyl-radical enzyme activating protein [Acutalibacteraceae bacterium]
MSHSKGFIFDIYRGTTHDGPGMRSTVFFKGCPLRCSWCHNPESISAKQQLWWEKNQCIGCGECVKACNDGNCIFGENGVIVDKEKCILCGKCVKACPTGALEFVGKEVTVSEIFSEIKKYDAYYKNYGGGVTASGGEPLLQYGFVKEFFALCKENGIHTALDTCGAVPFEYFSEVLTLTDCVLFDIKLMDTTLHKRYTGQENEQIISNLLQIAEEKRKGKLNCDIWIRTPLIPHITATKENIWEIASFIKENLDDVVSRFEMCAFNKACINKYEKLEIAWSLKDSPVISKASAEEFRKIAEEKGLSKDKIVISGILAG